MENETNNKKFIYQLEKRAKFKLIKRYDKPLSYHDIKMINDILFNQKTHYVEMFKEYLLYEDYNEFLKKYYNNNIVKIKLKKILIFYEKYSKIYANYTVIPESKYMYKNIKRKQKVIDQINNNNYKQFSENDDEYSISEYYNNTIFTKEILNSIYNRSNSSNKTNILNSTISKSSLNGSLNNFINKITNIEKEKEKLKTKVKKLDNINNNSKNISYSSLHKKNKKEINSENKNKFNNIKKNTLKENSSNDKNKIKNNSKNIEINNNSNNIIIYNYNYNMNDNINNINSLSNNDLLHNNHSINYNKANINLISEEKNKKIQKNIIKSNIDKAKQKIIYNLVRQSNEYKKINKIINSTNKNNNTSNNFYYFNNQDKDVKGKVNIRDNFYKKCGNFILSTNYLNSSKSINSKIIPSQSFFKNKNDKPTSKPKSSKNNKSNLSGYLSNKLIKNHKIKYYKNNSLLKYTKKISKTTKKLRNINKFQKEKNIKIKNHQRPECHRNYYYSQISSDNSENKLNIKNKYNNYNKKNKEEKNVLNSYLCFNDRKKNNNVLLAPYSINPFFSYSNLHSPINSLKNSPIYYSHKEINSNKKYNENSKSKEKKNLSVSKSKNSIKYNKSKFDLINKKFIDKAILILSERKNKSNKFKSFFKNKTEKQLLNKINNTKSYIIENSINNKIINKDNSLNKVIQGTNITPIKNKFNSKIKIKSKEKKNKIKNHKNNNNFTLFNKNKQSQKVIIKPNNIINNFNEAMNNYDNKNLILSERNKNKTIFSKK